MGIHTRHSQWRRPIGKSSNIVTLVLETPSKEITTIDYELKANEKRMDIERKIKSKGFRLLNIIYTDVK